MIAAAAVGFALCVNWVCYRWGRADERREWLAWAHTVNYRVTGNVITFPRRSA